MGLMLKGWTARVDATGKRMTVTPIMKPAFIVEVGQVWVPKGFVANAHAAKYPGTTLDAVRITAVVTAGDDGRVHYKRANGGRFGQMQAKQLDQKYVLRSGVVTSPVAQQQGSNSFERRNVEALERIATALEEIARLEARKA